MDQSVQDTISKEYREKREDLQEGVQLVKDTAQGIMQALNDISANIIAEQAVIAALIHKGDLTYEESKKFLLKDAPQAEEMLKYLFQLAKNVDKK